MWKVIFGFALINIALTAPADQANNLDFSPINSFALTLLENTYAVQENFGKNNFALSPLSVWSVFSLLTEGSSGETYQELAKGLKLPTDLKSTQALHLAVTNILKKNSDDVILKEQAAIFSDCTLGINTEFCHAARTYNTDIYQVNPKNTTLLANNINYYVCLATDGRITNVVKPENLENLVVAIIEALYFKANWTYTFDVTETHQRPFYNTMGKSIGAVNMMYHKAAHNLLDVAQIEAQVLEMTYGKDKEFSMLILLPFDGITVKKVISNLSAKPLTWLAELRKPDYEFEHLEVYLPRFKIASQVDLCTPLKYSGIHSIFDGSKAQLPGVSDVPLFVSKALQNVDVEVNEAGTIAVASTVVGLETRFGSPVFMADKEFVFLIMDRRSDVVLFAGVYETPSLI